MLALRLTISICGICVGTVSVVAVERRTILPLEHHCMFRPTMTTTWPSTPVQSRMAAMVVAVVVVVGSNVWLDDNALLLLVLRLQ